MNLDRLSTTGAAAGNSLVSVAPQVQGMVWDGTQWIQQQQPQLSKTEMYTAYYHQWTTYYTQFLALKASMSNNNDGSSTKNMDLDELEKQVTWSKYYSDLSSQAAHYFYQNPNAITAPFQLPPPPPGTATATTTAPTTTGPDTTTTTTTTTATQPTTGAAGEANVGLGEAALKRYVDQCLRQCTTNEAKQMMIGLIEQLIQKHLQDGTYESTNWGREPLLSLPATKTVTTTNIGHTSGGSPQQQQEHQQQRSYSTTTTPHNSTPTSHVSSNYGHGGGVDGVFTASPASGAAAATVAAGMKRDFGNLDGSNPNFPSSGHGYYGPGGGGDGGLEESTMSSSGGGSRRKQSNNHINNNNNNNKSKKTKRSHNQASSSKDINTNNNNNNNNNNKSKYNSSSQGGSSYYGPASSVTDEFISNTNTDPSSQHQHQQQQEQQSRHQYNRSISRSDSLTGSKASTDEDFISLPNLPRTDIPMKMNIGFNNTNEKLNDRMKRFAGPGSGVGVKGNGTTSNSGNKNKASGIGNEFDRFMGKGTIGSKSLVTLDESDYEKMTIKGTCTVLEKDYLRLTAPPRAELVRPQPVLEQHLHNIQAERATSNGATGTGASSTTRRDYLWYCSQLKAIRQDCTVQRIQNSFAVDVYETHARIALEEDDLNEYNQCQTQLKELYRLLEEQQQKRREQESNDNKVDIIGCGSEGDVTIFDGDGLKNRNEFIAYRIIYHVFLTGNEKYTGGSSDLFKIMVGLTPEQRIDPAIDHALKVRAACSSDDMVDYHAFFELFRSCPNLGSYLMKHMVPTIRHKALLRICKGYRPGTVETDFITIKFLGFDSVERGCEWLRSCNCVLSDDNSLLQTKESIDIRVSNIEEKKTLI